MGLQTHVPASCFPRNVACVSRHMLPFAVSPTTGLATRATLLGVQVPRSALRFLAPRPSACAQNPLDLRQFLRAETRPVHAAETILQLRDLARAD